MLNPYKFKWLFSKIITESIIPKLLCFSILHLMIISALVAASYLFVIRQPLSWSQTLFGIFSGVDYVMRGLGGVVIPPILKSFHVRDTICLFWAYVSQFATSMIFAFSKKTWMVFLCKCYFVFL